MKIRFSLAHLFLLMLILSLTFSASTFLQVQLWTGAYSLRLINQQGHAIYRIGWEDGHWVSDNCEVTMP